MIAPIILSCATMLLLSGGSHNAAVNAAAARGISNGRARIAVQPGHKLDPMLMRELQTKSAKFTQRSQVSSGPMTQGSPRHNLPTPEMVRAVGYECETHYVTTEDGCILALHRIPRGKDEDPTSSADEKKVVFLQHGLIASSADWVMPTPAKGLGYILADAGYDVWMGNYRGNTYSRNHTTLDPDVTSEGFWDFTWDELAKIDLPTQLEYVLTATGAEELQYVGHSMGTTTFMAMHQYQKDVATKVRLAHFLAPVGYMSNMESPLTWLAGLSDVIEWVLDMLGVGEFLPSNWLMDTMATLFCDEGWTQSICTNILFLICGYDEGQTNHTLLETIMHHTPAGASSHTVLHYVQEYRSGLFAGYDWGNNDENMLHHNGEPPIYNPQDVTSPVAIYYSDNDWLAAEVDVERLIGELGNVVAGMVTKVDYSGWNHLDYLWGIDADDYVYSQLLNNMELCWLKDCRIP